MQAPVSDREYIVETLGKDSHKESLKVAQKVRSLAACTPSPADRRCQLVADGRPDDPVPSVYSDMFSGGRCTITASRWLSLATPLTSLPAGSSEDYFSSDLSDSVLLSNLGKVGDAGVPVATLFSARDESMPSGIDKEKLLKRFVKALKGKDGSEGGLVKKLAGLSTEKGASEQELGLGECSSAIIAGAGHSVSEPKAMEELVTRIVDFVRASHRSL